MVTARLLMAPTLYFHEGFWMDVGLGSWGEGSDEADSTLACAPFKQNPPRPPHTHPCSASNAPTNFSSQREARARDGRIKFDLKEFYRSAR